jgi:hypothetical protein
MDQWDRCNSGWAKIMGRLNHLGRLELPVMWQMHVPPGAD